MGNIKGLGLYEVENILFETANNGGYNNTHAKMMDLTDYQWNLLDQKYSYRGDQLLHVFLHDMYLHPMGINIVKIDPKTMSKEDFDQLELGLYKFYWTSGGCSLAAVGNLSDGEKWFCFTNWQSKKITDLVYDIRQLNGRVLKAELIISNQDKDK